MRDPERGEAGWGGQEAGFDGGFVEREPEVAERG